MPEAEEESLDRVPGPDHRAATQWIDPKWIKDPNVRKALYGVAVGVGALLVALGFVTEDQVKDVLNIAGQLIMIGTGGLAFVNTARKRT